MIFTLVIILFISLFALNESRDPLWKILSSNYATKWKYTKLSKAESLSFWSDDGSKSWFNHVGIEIQEAGVAIYLPFFKRYISSILVPWEDVELKEKLFIGAMARFRIDCLAKQELYVSGKGIHLAISYIHKKEINNKINRKRQSNPTY